MMITELDPRHFAMPHQRNSLIQSIRLTGAGVTVRLRIERRRPQELQDFLRDNDLAERIDFTVNVPMTRSQGGLGSQPRLSAA